MKQKVIVCVGISGSGKSTFTKEYIKDNPHTLVCNRDSLRKSIFPDQVDWFKRKDIGAVENIVTLLQDAMFTESLDAGYDLIFDNTNLNEHLLRGLLFKVNFYPVDVSFKIFDTPKDKCKSNVLCRDFGYPLIWNTEENDYSKDKVFKFGKSDIIYSFSEVKYIDKQFENFQKIKTWLNENYKDKII